MNRIQSFCAGAVLATVCCFVAEYQSLPHTMERVGMVAVMLLVLAAVLVAVQWSIDFALKALNLHIEFYQFMWDRARQKKEKQRKNARPDH